MSKRPFDEVLRGLPGEDGDVQARYIEAVIPAPPGIVRVASVYLPNGNPVGSEKFAYKLAWMERLFAHVRDELLPLEMPLVLGGDYNVCPTDDDVYDPERGTTSFLVVPEAGRSADVLWQSLRSVHRL